MIDFESKSATQILEWAIRTFQDRFAIVASFQAESLVLIDLASRINPSVRVITLDTGRLPEETYQVMDDVRSRYGLNIEMVPPNAAELAEMLYRFGPNLFREDPTLRKLCCQIRKVRPLATKLSNVSAYATGLRRDQSEARHDVVKAEQEEGGSRTKLNPLADWTRDAVWHYLREHDLPIHPLYTRGYRSIGCAPCTRAVAPDEDERAGRWWWEQDDSECGLHVRPDGSLAPKVDVLLAEVLAS